MKHKSIQKELACAGEAFNLVVEAAEDPWRAERDGWALAEARKEAAEYAAKMQKTFEQCPGYVGGDSPTSPEGSGKVVVEPGRIMEAVPWLKRRFHVNERIDLSTDNGLVVEIKPRSRKAAGSVRLVKVHFGKPEQFTLDFS